MYTLGEYRKYTPQDCRRVNQSKETLRVTYWTEGNMNPPTIKFLTGRDILESLAYYSTLKVELHLFNEDYDIWEEVYFTDGARPKFWVYDY